LSGAVGVSDRSPERRSDDGEIDISVRDRRRGSEHNHHLFGTCGSMIRAISPGVAR